MYAIVAVVVGISVLLVSVVAVGRWVFRRMESSLKLFSEKNTVNVFVLVGWAVNKIIHNGLT